MRGLIILQHDQQPLRIKGQRLVPATIIAPREPDECWLTAAPVSYVGAFSPATVTLLGAGLLTHAAPAYRELMAAMGARGASFTEDLLQVNQPCAQLFLRQNDGLTAAYRRGRIAQAAAWRKTFATYWIPIQFTPAPPSWAGFARLQDEDFDIIAYGPPPAPPDGAVSLRCANLSGPTFVFTPNPN